MCRGNIQASGIAENFRNTVFQLSFEVRKDILHLEIFCSCALSPARNLSVCTLNELTNIDNKDGFINSKFQGFTERPNKTQKHSIN